MHTVVSVYIQEIGNDGEGPSNIVHTLITVISTPPTSTNEFDIGGITYPIVYPHTDRKSVVCA